MFKKPSNPHSFHSIHSNLTLFEGFYSQENTLMTALDFISLGRNGTVVLLSWLSVGVDLPPRHLDFAFHNYLQSPQSCVIMVFVSGWGWNIYTPLSKQSVTVSHYHTCLWASALLAVAAVHCWHLLVSVSASEAWVKQINDWRTSHSRSKFRSFPQSHVVMLVDSHGWQGGWMFPGADGGVRSAEVQLKWAIQGLTGTLRVFAGHL